MIKRIMTAEDVSCLYGIPVKSVWRYCRAGIIPHAKFGRMLRFDKELLDQWFANGGFSSGAVVNVDTNGRDDQ